MFEIYDESHAESITDFESLDAAKEELLRISKLPWDVEPNQAPCIGWRTCGWRYHINEFNTDRSPWKLLRDVYVLEIKKDLIDWKTDLKELK